MRKADTTSISHSQVFMSKERQKRGLAHRTFSLLPYQLVPYTKYSIPFIIRTVKLRHIEGLSLYDPEDYLGGFGQKDILSISIGQLLGFKQVIMDAIQRLWPQDIIRFSLVKEFPLYFRIKIPSDFLKIVVFF